MNTNLPSRKAASSAFTLIELLVVIGIIAVLAGLLMPVLSTARTKADQSKCVRQLQSWGHAHSLYAAEHQNELLWQNPMNSNNIIPYISTGDAEKVSRVCPAVKDPAVVAPTYCATRPVVNGAPVANTGSISLSLISTPSNYLFLIDSIVNAGTVILAPSDYDTMVAPIVSRHSNGANGLFADFHVEYIPWSRLQSPAAPERTLWNSVNTNN